METKQDVGKKLDLKKPSDREEDLSLIDRCLEMWFTKLSSRYCKVADFISLNNTVAGLVKAKESVRRGTDYDVVKRALCCYNLDPKKATIRMPNKKIHFPFFSLKKSLEKR